MVEYGLLLTHTHTYIHIYKVKHDDGIYDYLSCYYLCSRLEI